MTQTAYEELKLDRDALLAKVSANRRPAQRLIGRMDFIVEKMAIWNPFWTAGPDPIFSFQLFAQYGMISINKRPRSAEIDRVLSSPIMSLTLKDCTKLERHIGKLNVAVGRAIALTMDGELPCPRLLPLAQAGGASL